MSGLALRFRIAIAGLAGAGLGSLDVSVDRARDDLVSPSCLVLVDDRSALAVVSHSRHQILQACPAGCGEVVAGVPEIVKRGLAVARWVLTQTAQRDHRIGDRPDLSLPG